MGPAAIGRGMVYARAACVGFGQDGPLAPNYQNRDAANVRSGSIADIASCNQDVRFTREERTCLSMDVC